MSNSDSFIQEVSEEVRRDRFYALLRRYGWIAVLAVLLVVAGAAWNEWRKAATRTAAEELGDAVLAALEQPELQDREAALAAIETDSPGGQVVVEFLRAGTLAAQGDAQAAADQLEIVAVAPDVPDIYRQIAGFKAVILQVDTLDPADLRQRLSGFAVPGAPLRLLAEEQLALLDHREGDTDAAIARLRAILEDFEVDAALRQRAQQLIVAFGGDLDAPA